MLVNEDKSAPSSASLSQFETENGELRGQVKLLKELLKEKERENAQRLQEMGAQSVRANEEAGEVGRKDKAKRKQAAKDVAAM
jgi:hypothetical protein